MSRTNAKYKFNILFDNTTVSDFVKSIDLDRKDLFLASKQRNSEDPLLKEGFFRRLGSLCGGVKRGLDEYLLDSIDQAEEPASNNDDVTIDYVYISDSRYKVCAILLAHRGECVEAPGWWTVRLICNRQGDESCKGQAAILLGLYMYALKKKGVQTHGLLEVADNYKNIAGYCLYSRFGFEETNIKCRAFAWMTMATEISKITIPQIIETTKTGEQQIADTGATLYCRELKRASRERRKPKKRSAFSTPRPTKRVEYTPPSPPGGGDDGASGCIIL